MQRNLFPIDRFHLQETGVMVSSATLILLSLLYIVFIIFFIFIFRLSFYCWTWNPFRRSVKRGRILLLQAWFTQQCWIRMALHRVRARLSSCIFLLRILSFFFCFLSIIVLSLLHHRLVKKCSTLLVAQLFDLNLVQVTSNTISSALVLYADFVVYYEFSLKLWTWEFYWILKLRFEKAKRNSLNHF